MTLDALIFDFDGLIMDTESTLLESWRWEWRQHGLELPAEGFFAAHGGPVPERYEALAAAVGAGYDRQASHERRNAYRQRLHETLPPAPGIRDWFDQAAELELRLAVASSSDEQWVHGHLARAGLLSRIEVTACGNEVAGHKPDPAVYLLALQRLGLGADRALAFEDTPHGVAAARAAGLRCVAVPNAFVAADRFGRADLVLTSAADIALAALIDKIS
ncbi:haloacid dehalogenase [Paractinoplanes abujensis]|uniref:Putative hydrolase of the HAD superfamily n=1 Tax=Paractinoplanes abujensis TaxID=882441 RepID=A0A7W7G100_9ACTN|nr:HAD-IA family hydrolase [Actinoplanes abujensis]MBB4692167.1 putative hydrolase of the HAD superfamily [Actinoplanes abujensis]GID16418.1 haloacid dehalogenase [Actinoplanes abujensis]